MIRTLKITTIVAAILCISLVGFVAVFGLRGNPEIENFINSPRIVQEFKNLVTKAPSNEGQISPLVREAQKFALRIDPPPPPVTIQPPVTRGPSDIPTPKAPPVTEAVVVEPPRFARFDLIATCRYEDSPSKSMVLLDLPGKGQKWFRVGENVEHLVIADVLDGSVVMSQSGRNPQTIALKQQPPLARSLLLAEGQTLEAPVAGRISYEPVSIPATPASSLGRGNAYFVPEGGTRAPRTAAVSPLRQPPSIPPRSVPLPATRPRTVAAPPSTEQRKAVLDENIADLKSIMTQTVADASKAEVAEEQKALAKLLEILEQEKKLADQQSKVTTADSGGSTLGE
ncbi:MAG: hypothetical protein IH624_04455 [Phycisphaerae bacterium]|nr:hypothetical protein [Phycisphaerae bacterium]